MVELEEEEEEEEEGRVMATQELVMLCWTRAGQSLVMGLDGRGGYEMG